ncbi:MAG: hypothetical protein ACYCV0_00995 [Desulfitobacteriaceae bacterium]
MKVKAWYYNQCIKIGEAAAIYLREGDEATAEEYARKFMELPLTKYALTLIFTLPEGYARYNKRQNCPLPPFRHWQRSWELLWIINLDSPAFIC